MTGMTSPVPGRLRISSSTDCSVIVDSFLTAEAIDAFERRALA
jgi:hypothetical protein